MVAKNKATTGRRQIKKLKLKKETIKDLDVPRGKGVKGGALATAAAACYGDGTLECGGGTGTIGCRVLTYGCTVVCK